MADYISRDYTVENMENYPWDTEHDKNAAVHLVRELVPAADVRPVVHGEWVYEEPNGANNFKGCYWCDQCHQPINHKKNFCPNCGADMGEGSK